MKVWGKVNPTAQWTANPEPDLAGYILYWGSTPGVYTSNVDVGNVTSYGLPSITPLQKWYYFSVTAYDTSGNESGYAEEFDFYVSDPYTTNVTGTILAKRG